MKLPHLTQWYPIWLIYVASVADTRQMMSYVALVTDVRQMMSGDVSCHLSLNETFLRITSGSSFWEHRNCGYCHCSTVQHLMSMGDCYWYYISSCMLIG